MPQSLNVRSFRLACVLILASIPMLATQEAQTATPAPVPTQITSDAKVFIANAGMDPNPHAGGFSGGPERAYNQFYAAMANWGRYRLVATPADADLAFQIRLEITLVRGRNSPSVVDNSQLRLIIRDVRTHVVLWTVSEPVQDAILQGTWDKNFDQAMNQLMDDVKRLAQPGSPQPVIPKTGNGKN